MMQPLSLDETKRRFQLAIDTARGFFDVPMEVKIELLAESPSDMTANASITWHPASLQAVIKYDMQHLSERPEKIWQAAGHEVAHLVSRELVELRDTGISSGSPFSPVLDHDFVVAIEKLTVRLERLFMRNHQGPKYGD